MESTGVNSSILNVAVWNLPPVDLLMAGFSSGEHADRFDVQKRRPAECEDLLRENQVDVALLPTLTVLKNYKDFDVLPVIAYSTWSNPFVRLAIRDNLGGRIQNVAYNPECEHERMVCEIVLREHYRIEPEFVSHPDASNESLVRVDTDAQLLVGPDVPIMRLEGQGLDLGQEWFELANYPMTWALFAGNKGSLGAETIVAFREGVRASEQQREVWIRAQETTGELREFYSDGVRFLLDDLCVAGLTEFRQFLFFYDVVDDVREIPFVFLPDENGRDDEGKPLL